NELTIPYGRIQAIEVEQNILRKVLNVSRIVANTAASGDKKEEINPIIFPLISNREIEPFLEEFVPDYKGINDGFHPPDKKGLKYYLLKNTFSFLLVLMPVIYFFPSYSWIPGNLFLLSLGLGWMKIKET